MAAGNLRKLEEVTGLRLFQQCSQRFLAPVSGPISHWPHETEVYLSNLPLQVEEDFIYSEFIKFGKILQIRLVVNKQCRSLGYAFVLYSSREEAWKAVMGFKGTGPFRFLNGKYNIRVSISKDNRRLLFRGIETWMSESEIFDLVKQITPGLEKVLTFKDYVDPRKNRGFCFLEYMSHKEALEAKVNLKLYLLNHRLEETMRVSWANDEPSLPPHVQNTIETVFMRGLKIETNKACILSAVCTVLCVDRKSVVRISRKLDYAFITFSNRNTALNAVRFLQGLNIDGAEVEVQMARPNPKVENYTEAAFVQWGPLQYQDLSQYEGVWAPEWFVESGPYSLREFLPAPSYVNVGETRMHEFML